MKSDYTREKIASSWLRWSNFPAKKFFQFLGFGKSNLVGGHEKVLIHPAESVFDQGLIFVGAEKQAHQRIVALGHLVLQVVVHIGVELTGIGVIEGLYL